ncbi:MAG: GNAT family N-acetyltransferase [Betaproteobacteria bacterium]|nr:GNAT family N-acetyltransferase [Betaproteobacteria bacterium]
MFPIAKPPIATTSLTLRTFVPEDAAKVFAMSQEIGIRTWLSDQVYEDAETALEVLQYLIAQCRDPGTPALGPYVLGICLTRSLELIGHVGLSPLNDQVEVGCAIEHRFQGRGFATEAIKAMSEWGMQSFGLAQVQGIVASENIASCKVLERAGFAFMDESTRSLHGQSRLVRTYRKDRG